MPVFTIKAKDNLALRAVDAYRALCVKEGLTEQAEQVVEAYAEMVSWRLHHPDLCHQSDHKHVAVFEGAADQREPTLPEAEEILTGEAPSRGRTD
jgi:hypothetical protein